MAHTISRAASLSHLADERNHVRRFVPTSPNPEGIGWREASTFRGFCDVHDAMFSPIDDPTMTSSEETCFLLVYRSIAFELYQKAASYASRHATLAVAKRRGISRDALEALQGLEEGTVLGLRDLTTHKALLDRELLKREYGSWTHLLLRFTGPAALACAGGYAPYVDLQDAELQDFHDKDLHVETIAFATVHSKDVTTLVMSWRRNSNVGGRFCSSLLQFPEEHLPHIAAQIPFLCLENTYFNGVWWDSRRQWIKDKLRELSNTPSPCLSTPELATKHVVDWKFAEMRTV